MSFEALQQPLHTGVIRIRPAKKKHVEEKDVGMPYTYTCNKDSVVEALADPSVLRSNYGASYYSNYQGERKASNYPATGLGVMSYTEMNNLRGPGERDSDYISPHTQHRGPNYVHASPAPPPVSGHNSMVSHHYQSSPQNPTSIRTNRLPSTHMDDHSGTTSTPVSRQMTKDYVNRSPYAPPINIQPLDAGSSPDGKHFVPKSFIHPGHGESTYLLDYIPPSGGGIADTIVYSRKINPETRTSNYRVDGSTGGKSSASEYSQNYIAVRIEGKDYLAHLTPFDGTSPNHLRGSLPALELAEDGTCIEIPAGASDSQKPSKKDRAKTPKKERAKTPKGGSAKTPRK